MKKSILIMLLSIGIFSMNAQDGCICPNGTLKTSTFTYLKNTFTITYMDCNPSVKIKDIKVDGTGSVHGKLTFIDAINGFFKNNPSFETIEMPASCKKWVVTGKSPNPVNDAEGGLFIINYGLQDCSKSDACCFFRKNGNGIVESSSNEEAAKEACIDEQYCFPVCEQY